MDAQVYVLIAVVVLAVVFAVVLWTGRGERSRRLTPLAGVAFGLVIAGLVFGEHRLLGYTLVGAGVAVAIVDIVRRSGHRPV